MAYQINPKIRGLEKCELFNLCRLVVTINTSCYKGIAIC